MALSSCLLQGGKLIVAVQTLFFICSLRCRYSIRQATAHAIYSVYDVVTYTVYCTMDGCNTLAITHNPEATGSSPVPATMFNRWFRKKSAVFLYFLDHLENIRVGDPESGKSYGKAVVSKKCTTWRCFFWYLKSKFWVYFEQQAKGECINTYITFDFNGSSEVTSKTMTVIYGEVLALNLMPTRWGSVFVGWYDAGDGDSNEKSTNDYNKAENCTLYA